MAIDMVRDYLGHPCKLAEAYELFDLESARRDVASDSRLLARQLGISLMLLMRRSDVITNALQAALDSMPPSTDDDATRAILEMAKDYDLANARHFDRLGSLALIALERAGLATNVRAEVPHG